MSFPDLAPELQDLIIKELHPTAALALSATNHFYHDTATLARLPLDTVRRYLWELEVRPDNITENGTNHLRFACNYCHSMKFGFQFGYGQVFSSCYKEYSGDEHDRRCLACSFNDGLVEAGEIYRSWDWLPVLICTGCHTPQKDYCWLCRFCTTCLKTRNVEFCTECGWCKDCILAKHAEWNSITARDTNEEDKARAIEAFKMKYVCDCHHPNYSPDAVDLEPEDEASELLGEGSEADVLVEALANTDIDDHD